MVIQALIEDARNEEKPQWGNTETIRNFCEALPSLNLLQGEAEQFLRSPTIA